MALVLLAALGLLSGCSKAAAPVLDEVRIDAWEGSGVASMNGQQLELQVKAAFGAVGFEVLPQDRAGSSKAEHWRLVVAAGVEEPQLDDPLPQLRAAVVLSLRKVGEAGASFEVKAWHIESPSRARVEDIVLAAQKALGGALARAATEARAMIELRGRRDEAVAAALSRGNAEEQWAAVRVLASRRHSAALKPLLQRAQADDLNVLREVMGLLVELGDERAVPELINASRARDNVVQREIVFAVGALGGSEAEAYLDVVATGHDDALVRASAQQALLELRKRRETQALQREGKEVKRQ